MDLKRYLEWKGIKQKNFSEQVGISDTYLRSIMKGAMPNLGIALAIEIATDGKVIYKDLIPEEIKKAIVNRMKTLHSIEMEEVFEEKALKIKEKSKRKKHP